jgi:membrane protease YdiL (CAAX protease family)
MSGTVSTEDFTVVLSDWMPWLNVFAALAAASFYFILRGRRLLTTDITTTIPVGHNWGRIFKAIVMGYGVLAIIVGVNWLVNMLTGRSLSGASSSFIGSINTSVVGVIYIVLIGPVVEEIVFRGAILRHLMPYGVNFAIVTQALLFSLYHMNFYQSLYAFFLGLVLGYIASHYSLKWSIAFHIFNNGISMLASLGNTPGIIYEALLALCLIGAIIIGIRDRQTGKLLIAEGRSKILAKPFATGWTQPFFLTVVIVLFIVGIIVNAVMM